MIGIIGSSAIILAFLSAVAATIFYYLAAANKYHNAENVANFFYMLKGSMVLFASGLLLYILLTNQFQYYYVFNYTSLDLQTRYLIAAFYSGQEGSFLLWILCGFLVGLGILKYTEDTYRSPVMFFMTLTQAFLLSMIVGISLYFFDLGASPFRTLFSEMSDAPVFRSNPDFIPADGSGLNDLLRSPWIVIHPPIIFIGFAMMTVPFAFALASLWKRKYHEWIYPALPWTLGANLALLTAIFLAGYWAYETLSFGGYWAWDPVENASLVPWIFGMAGIHTMLIQKKSTIAHKGSIIFAVLAYATIIYQTFLTRSGVLGEASVHSFVDLGLYNQLLLFVLTITALGAGLILYRYKELPKPQKEAALLSREFLMFSGAFILFMTGFVIILGTSSPILGRLFVANPTPPDPVFYNQWTLPFAILIAVFTVLTQYIWWKKQDAESLSSELISPTFAASIVTVVTIMLADIDNLWYMVYLFAAYFAVIGNSIIMVRLIARKPKLIGGTVTHIGLGVLFLGFLGAAYDRPLLDQETRNYNRAVLAGQVMDSDGFPVHQTIEFIELERGKPKLLDNRYMVTYLDAEITNHNRPGEQRYKIHFENINNPDDQFYLYPIVYPMLANSAPGAIEWTVEPEIRTGLTRDLYMYVAGSALVDQEIERMNRETAQQGMQTITGMGADQALAAEEQNTVEIRRGSEITFGDYTVHFVNFQNVAETEIEDETILAVRASIQITHNDTEVSEVVNPLFVIFDSDEGPMAYSPPSSISEFEASVRFTEVNPNSETITLEFDGITGEVTRDWILLAAEHKPFISVVWLGTFLLMFGFSISIFRRWQDQKKREAKAKAEKRKIEEVHLEEEKELEDIIA